jgi:hypothetical protein
MSGVVIVGKCENHDASLVDFLEEIDPFRKFTFAVNDHFVPGFRLFLDPFAVPQPSNLTEIRGNQIEFVLHLPRSRHPALIN